MMLLKEKKKVKLPSRKTVLKTTVYVMEGLAIAIFLYMVILPFYPRVVYTMNVKSDIKAGRGGEERYKNLDVVKEQVRDIKNHLPESAYAVSPNRVIITKIGVNAPIVESRSSEYGLSRGAWHVPDSSTPDRGGNTVITGHRFKYLPPNNLTFYLFHELEAGDMVSVIWEKEDYLYRIRETKIIEPTEVSILEDTEDPVLTMFTCHPIYSTEKRLVVVADLVEGPEDNPEDPGTAADTGENI